MGGLDRGNGHDTFVQAQLVDGFAGHQGHDAERPGLHLDLCHHGVLQDARHDAARRLRRFANAA